MCHQIAYATRCMMGGRTYTIFFYGLEWRPRIVGTCSNFFIHLALDVGGVRRAHHDWPTKSLGSCRSCFPHPSTVLKFSHPALQFFVPFFLFILVVVILIVRRYSGPSSSLRGRCDQTQRAGRASALSPGLTSDGPYMVIDEIWKEIDSEGPSYQAYVNQ